MTDKIAIPESIRKLRMADELFQFAYQVKKYQLSLKHPDYDEAKLHAETMRFIVESTR